MVRTLSKPTKVPGRAWSDLSSVLTAVRAVDLFLRIFHENFSFLRQSNLFNIIRTTAVLYLTSHQFQHESSHSFYNNGQSKFSRIEILALVSFYFYLLKRRIQLILL